MHGTPYYSGYATTVGGSGMAEGFAKALPMADGLDALDLVEEGEVGCDLDPDFDGLDAAVLADEIVRSGIRLI